jgi:hypothetical protein
VTYCAVQFTHYIIYKLHTFRPNKLLHSTPYQNAVCYLYLLNHNLYHLNVASAFTCRVEIFFSRLRKLVSQTVWTVGLRAEWHNVLLNPKVTDRIIDIDTEQKLLLNRIIQQYVKRMSVRAAVS